VRKEFFEQVSPDPPGLSQGKPWQNGGKTDRPVGVLGDAVGCTGLPCGSSRQESALLLQTVEPSEKAGSIGPMRLAYAERSKTYVYSTVLILGTLYVAEGLK
jgi:hypothetical protein